MKKVFNIITISLVAASLALTGCELKEKNYSNVDANSYYVNESNVKGAVAAIYANSARGFAEFFEKLQELSADQVAWRTWNAGGWGWDEAKQFVLSSQTWNAEAIVIEQAWQNAWRSIGLCNQLIDDLKRLDPKELNMTKEQMEAYIAEVRTLRAWAYYNNFELWGGALPLCASTSSEIPGSIDPDFNTGCQKMFDFIYNELEESFVNLQDKGANRVGPAMNRMLLMRLLLNSEVFTGVARYDKCKEVCDFLEENYYGPGKKYDIVADYREIFSINNEKCQEVVFAFALNQQSMFEMRNMRDVPFLPYTFKDILEPATVDAQIGAWNCYCLAPSYDNAGSDLGANPTVNADGTAYNSSDPVCFLDAKYGDKLGAVYARFEDGDIRKQSYSFPEGGQWNGGIFLKGAMTFRNDRSAEEAADGKAHKKGEPIPADADRDGAPLIYVDQVGQFGGTSSDVAHPVEVVESPRWGQTNSGYRLMKYPMYPVETGINYLEVSEVEFRWAEVAYTKAECEMRLSGANPRTNAEVMKVRNRYFTGAATDNVAASWTNEEWMLHQWGLEFLNEGRRRRTDLRRFDKFTQGQWWFFGRTKDDAGSLFPAKRDRKYEWYPLPASALGVNPGLKQNPNY